MSIFTLYFWNMGNFLSQVASYDLLNANYWLCKFGNYIQFLSLQISAWLLVCMSMDQYLAIRLIHWRTLYFKAKHALLASLLVIAFFVALNAHIVATFGYMGVRNQTLTSTSSNGTTTTVQVVSVSVCICYYDEAYKSATRWMEIWGRIHLLFYSVLPFALIIACNTALIVFLVKQRRRGRSKTAPTLFSTNTTNTANIISASSSLSSSFSSTESTFKQKRSRSINWTICCVTFLFVCMTLPNAFASFFFSQLFASDVGATFVMAANAVSFTYHGLSFALFYATNRVYRLEATHQLLRLRQILLVKPPLPPPPTPDNAKQHVLGHIQPLRIRQSLGNHELSPPQLDDDNIADNTRSERT